MKTRFLAVIVLVAVLSVPTTVLAKSSFWKMSDWFRKQNHSTTVTGSIDSVDGRKIMFKTDDGQVLQLTGRKAEKLAEHRGAVLRVFGNVRKPDAKFPSGGIEVRNFRVTEEARPVAAAPVEEPTPAPAPEPVMEPEPEPAPAPEPIAEPVPEPEPAPEPVVESAPIPGESGGYEGKTTEYKVEKGDTLAKISKKVYGSTKKWKKIAEANKISNPKALKVGMTLQIPE